MTARRLIVICGRVASVHSIAVIAAFAWADGCSWFKVIPLLEARGLHVVAVQNPLRSLDDVATTSARLHGLRGAVLLVGHSYGGAVITQAGDDPKA